jgi:hypothetical protein
LIVEWRGSGKDTYDVNLIGGQPDGYLAVGWPTVGDMGPTPVVVCANGGLTNNNKHTAIYWNTADRNSTPVDVSSTEDPVSNVMVMEVNGVLTCSFTLKANFQIGNETKDLNNKAYYVILATGPLQNGKIMQHTKEGRGHSPAPFYWADYNSYLPFNYADCNTGGIVGCEGLPMGCVANRNCSVLLRFAANAKDSYEFSLSGQAMDPTSAYLAVGLSLDDKMANDSVVACIPNYNVGVVMYWNKQYDSIPLPNTTVGLSDGTVSQADGVITCSFILQVGQLQSATRVLNYFNPNPHCLRI